MAAAMSHKFVMFFHLRTSSIRPTIRNFHRLTNPRSLSVSSLQLKSQKHRNTSDFTFNKNDFVFTSRISAVGDVLSVRFNSSSGGTVPYLSPPPNIPSETLHDMIALGDPKLQSLGLGSEKLDVVNALGEPTLQSLGLGSWSPVGMVQQLTEFLHITLDIPWWGAICLLTVCLRALMFPIFIKSQRNAVHLSNIMPEMTRHQTKFTEAKKANDNMAMAIAHRDLNNFMRESNFSPFKFMYPMMQAPIFLSVFWGLQGMANAPVASMKDGGMLWFTDLTLADPTCFLPVICSGLLLATVEVGADGVRTDAMAKGLRWFMRGMPIVFIPIMMNFPSAVLCYWVTSNTISLTLVAMLKIPGVKPFFKIPKRVVHDNTERHSTTGTVKTPVFKGIRDSWENAKLQERIRRKEAMELSLLKQSASEPISKAPTGSKPIKSEPVLNTRQITRSKK